MNIRSRDLDAMEGNVLKKFCQDHGMLSPPREPLPSRSPSPLLHWVNPLNFPKRVNPLNFPLSSPQPCSSSPFSEEWLASLALIDLYTQPTKKKRSCSP